MKQRTRIYYSAAQRAEIWDRWQRGESMSSIGRVFERASSSIFPLTRLRTATELSISFRTLIIFKALAMEIFLSGTLMIMCSGLTAYMIKLMGVLV